MRWLIPLLLLAGSAAAQDPADEALKRIDKALQAESERLRGELLDLVRQELKGGGAPRPALPSAPATAGTALALVTEELLRKHAAYLASDELEGRMAGTPGNDKAAAYIAGVMKDAGLSPGGDAGGWLQKFRVGGKDTNNVVGLLEGTDAGLKKEFVVVGAHFDHVGTSDQKQDFGRLPGKGDDKIWNGADDNGSGTTSLLAIAKAFGEGRLRTKRTMVFIAFSGEEAGLYGSAFYTGHPAGPIDKHVFMLNLDMVGRNPHRPMEIYGVGSGEGTSIRGPMERAVAKSGLVAKIHDDVKLVGGDSDHTSFRQKKVPFAFFFSGFHADYHRPSDHPEKLDYPNLLKVVHTSVHLLQEIADAADRPVFSGLAGRGRGLELPDFGEPARPARRLGVTVQELDDTECANLGLAAGQGGLRVDEVHDRGVASASGMKVGDTIVSLAGSPLPRSGTREGLRRLMAEKVKPGQEVEVGVLRSGGKVLLKAKWTE